MRRSFAILAIAASMGSSVSAADGSGGFALVRCAEPVTRAVRFDIAGLAENGTEYRYGYMLAKSEIPPDILAAYGGNWGGEEFASHRLRIAVAVDARGDLLAPPPPEIVFQYSAWADPMVEPFSIDPDMRRPAAYRFLGFEYRYVGADGARFRAPQFDLIGWGAGDDEPASSPAAERYFQPDFAAMPPDPEEVREFTVETPWTVEGGC
ncbi:MAG: hypothetical protein ACK5MQ_09045 [Pikeienuella sp.]